jgi:phage terminase large subunit-like protein
VFVDEIAQWATTPGPQRLWEAVSTAVAKTSQARMVVLTTAGDPAHWSHKVLEHAEADPMWRVHQVPGPAPWMEQDRLDEQRRRLPEASYRRLFLNEWTEAEDRLTTIDDLQACVTLDGPQAPQPGNRYVIGLDLGLTSDLTAAVVCHLAEDAVVLDRINTWTGTSEHPVQIGDVETWITQACITYHPATVVLDPWQAIDLAQRLKRKRIRVEEFTFSAASVGRLATTVHILLREHRFALPQNTQLLDELANVRLRETSPGVYRMDHDPDKHDDQAIALALAANHLITRPQKRKWAAY